MIPAICRFPSHGKMSFSSRPRILDAWLSSQFKLLRCFSNQSRATISKVLASFWICSSFCSTNAARIASFSAEGSMLLASFFFASNTLSLASLKETTGYTPIDNVLALPANLYLNHQSFAPVGRTISDRLSPSEIPYCFSLGCAACTALSVSFPIINSL